MHKSLIAAALVLVISAAAHADAYDDLAAAVKSGDASRVNSTLTDHGDLKAATHNGAPALDAALALAADSGSDQVADALVSAGANPNGKGDSGTIIACAIRGDHASMVEYLLGKGVDANRPDSAGNHPLYYVLTDITGHVARSSPSSGEAIADVLIKRGADVNAKDSIGRTYVESATFALRQYTTPKLHIDPAPIQHYIDYLRSKGAR